MEGASDIVIFFGRFHPLILHFPIGFLAIAFALEILSRCEKFRQYKPAVGFVLLLGAISSVVAAVLGYMLAQAGGYNKDLLVIHQWSGIGLAIAAVTALVLYWQSQIKGSAWLDKAYLSVLFFMVIFLIIAGHYGGSLTHGSDYLVQYMPNPLRKIAGMPLKKSKETKITNLNEAVVFTDIIYPILDARCVTCHNESKSKGDLMLHSPEALLEGGESGLVFVAGNAEESEMMKRIHLPENDEEHMPPEGKSQLTDGQVELLTWWINEGASFNKTVAEIKVDEAVQAELNTFLDPNANKTEVEKLLASEIKPADEQVLQQLMQVEGIQVRPLAVDTYWLQARILQSQQLDSLMRGLIQISEQLTWLDLRGTSTNDASLSSISQLRNLTRLHLENTKVTDEVLQHLKKLPYLEYLNLYGTEVSDEGIQQLAGLKNLRRLYVWRTKVTEEGALELKKALPELKLNLGMESGQDNTNVATVRQRHSAISGN